MNNTGKKDTGAKRRQRPNKAPVVMRETLVLTSNSRSSFEIPTSAFQKIRKHFPADAVAWNMEFPSFRDESNYLVHVHGDRTTIYTRADVCLKKMLEEAGYVVDLSRWGPEDAHLLEPNSSSLNSTIDPKRLVAESLKHACSCQFVVDSESAVTRLAGALAQAFPDAPCVFLFPSFAEAELFASRFRQECGLPITLTRGKGQTPEFRCCACPYQAAMYGQFSKIPLVVVIDSTGRIQKTLKVLSKQPDLQRFYLLRSRQTKVSKRDEIEFRHWVGPEIDVTRYNQDKTRHRLHIFKFGGETRTRRKTGRKTGHEKRKLYWKHDRRNQVIARLAKQIGSTVPESALPSPQRQRVAILVETTEHAEELKQHLPDWPVITLKSERKDLPPTMIVTLSAAAGSDQFSPSDLIVASGGPASPWTEQWLGERAGREEVVRVFDLTDGFSDEAASLSGERQRSYKEAGAIWRPLPRELVKQVLGNLKKSA